MQQKIRNILRISVIIMTPSIMANVNAIDNSTKVGGTKANKVSSEREQLFKIKERIKDFDRKDQKITDTIDTWVAPGFAINLHLVLTGAKRACEIPGVLPGLKQRPWGTPDPFRRHLREVASELGLQVSEGGIISKEFLPVYEPKWQALGHPCANPETNRVRSVSCIATIEGREYPIYSPGECSYAEADEEKYKEYVQHMKEKFQSAVQKVSPTAKVRVDITTVEMQPERVNPVSNVNIGFVPAVIIAALAVVFGVFSARRKK